MGLWMVLVYLILEMVAGYFSAASVDISHTVFYVSQYANHKPMVVNSNKFYIVKDRILIWDLGTFKILVVNLFL